MQSKIYYSNISLTEFNENDPIKDIGILVSYYGLKKIFKPNFCDKLFLDSGAFSAWNLGITLDPKKYGEFIKGLNFIDVVASLDDITSYEKSIDNYKYLKYEMGIDVLPCFHYGEPFSILKYYTEQDNYVALGGIAKTNKRERLIWLDRIFNLYPNKAEIGFHGFGIQDREILLKYPWKSVDATSAHVLARFGGICSPYGDIKINEGVDYKGLKWMTPQSRQQLKDWVQSLGFDYEKAIQPTGEGTKMRLMINILYYEDLAKSIPDTFKFKKMQTTFFEM